jgi:hypothetical protein
MITEAQDLFLTFIAGCPDILLHVFQAPSHKKLQLHTTTEKLLYLVLKTLFVILLRFLFVRISKWRFMCFTCIPSPTYLRLRETTDVEHKQERHKEHSDYDNNHFKKRKTLQGHVSSVCLPARTSLLTVLLYMRKFSSIILSSETCFNSLLILKMGWKLCLGVKATTNGPFIHSQGDIRVNMGQRWCVIGRGRKERSKKNLSKFYLHHHESHIHCSGNKPEPPLYEARCWLHVLRHGQL